MKIERVSNGYIVEENGTKTVHENLDEVFSKIKTKVANSFSNQRTIYEFNYELKQADKV